MCNRLIRCAVLLALLASLVGCAAGLIYLRGGNTIDRIGIAEEIIQGVRSILNRLHGVIDLVGGHLFVSIIFPQTFQIR